MRPALSHGAIPSTMTWDTVSILLLEVVENLTLPMLGYFCANIRIRYQFQGRVRWGDARFIGLVQRHDPFYVSLEL